MRRDDSHWKKLYQATQAYYANPGNKLAADYLNSVLRPD